MQYKEFKPLHVANANPWEPSNTTPAHSCSCDTVKCASLHWLGDIFLPAERTSKTGSVDDGASSRRRGRTTLCFKAVIGEIFTPVDTNPAKGGRSLKHNPPCVGAQQLLPPRLVSCKGKD